MGYDNYSFFTFMHNLMARITNEAPLFDPTHPNYRDEWGLTCFTTLSHLVDLSEKSYISPRAFDTDEMEKYLNLFSTDLSNKQEKIDLRSTPFLRYQDLYIWGLEVIDKASLFENFLYSLFKKNANNRNAVKILKNNFKKRVEEECKKHNMNTILDCRNSEGKNPIDILAFDVEDNCLIILDTRLALDHDDIHIENKHLDKAIRIGKKHLVESVNNIKDYLTPEIKEQLGIKANRFKIRPALITPTVYGGYDLGDKIKRVSFYDLNEFLTDKKLKISRYKLKDKLVDGVFLYEDVEILIKE